MSHCLTKGHYAGQKLGLVEKEGTLNYPAIIDDACRVPKLVESFAKKVHHRVKYQVVNEHVLIFLLLLKKQY